MPRFDARVLNRLGVKTKRLATDSRQIKPGDTFIAYPGEKLDGRNYIPRAIAAGAGAVLWEKRDFKWNPQWKAANLGVNGLREKASVIANRIYGRPSHKLWVIGVTGTNGKTSCSHWIAQCLTRLGKKTAVVGTLGNGFPGRLEPTVNTTPDAVLLQELLAGFLQRGAQCVVIEVSSHSLTQGRVNGVAFDVAVFTNLSRDHLDYHGSMQAYAAAKAKLFHWPGLRCAIVNLDDRFGRELARQLEKRRVKVLGYGFGKGDIAGHRLDLARRGLSLEIRTRWGGARLQSRMLGKFNAANLLAVLGVLLVSGVKLEPAVRALQEIKPPSGRLQIVKDQPLVVVDYAHTPDALKKVLQSLRSIAQESSGKLVCVFGCGGDRDRGKRPQMGRVAVSLADQVVVTSDNPRSEDPLAIIADIARGWLPGFKEPERAPVVEPDRAKAIRLAISGAAENDVVLIAGKGHEDYQEIGGEKMPFSDVRTAQTVLQESAG
ncbi:MAG TPA: UDP-N-acetylmuramoyl-L-alanyl-D-glutamate--2,6-diaminopimelate ligase [Burkholderiales bacterium]|nr:UDP-N-acetylmuramoyl-L-alanyl-D-glutamate--2,6-diaminopimelate ligase [Burkholderiales bacterium]